MISLHISNRLDIPLMFILKYLFDIFVDFQKKGGVIIHSLCNENIVVLDFINDNSMV